MVACLCPGTWQRLEPEDDELQAGQESAQRPLFKGKKNNQKQSGRDFWPALRRDRVKGRLWGQPAPLPPPHASEVDQGLGSCSDRLEHRGLGECVCICGSPEGQWHPPWESPSGHWHLPWETGPAMRYWITKRQQEFNILFLPTPSSSILGKITVALLSLKGPACFLLLGLSPSLSSRYQETPSLK